MDKRIEILSKQKPDYCDNDNKPLYNEDQVLAFGQEYADLQSEQAFIAGKEFQFNYDDRKNHWEADAPDYPEWLQNIKKDRKL